MQLIRHRPPAPLAEHIEWFWWSRRDEPEIMGEHMLPSGAAQLILPLHEAPIVCRPSSSSLAPLVWSRGIVHGPQWSYYRSGPKLPGIVAGVSFRPGRAGAMLGASTAELSDRHVPIGELWGGRGEELRERLLTASGPAAVFRALEREFAARLERAPPLHPAIARALAPHAGAWAHSRVSFVQRESGYSPRHFAALFRAAVGLTPKHYFRVRRFTAVLESLAAGEGRDLAQVAAAAGYSDQSHLTREFREFAGITPTRYRPRDRTSVLHHRIT